VKIFQEDSIEGLHFPEIPPSPKDVNQDKAPEPTTSCPLVKESIGIPATWLQVEDLWLHLYVSDEAAALNTAMDFVQQLQNLSK
jgi:hypothetical protein